MKTIIAFLFCGLFLTSCRPALDRIFGAIDDILTNPESTIEVTKIVEVTRIVEVTVVVTPTYTPTPTCTVQPTLSPLPSKTQEPSADHRFIVTKLPP